MVNKAKVKLKLAALVRDKDGHPKFSDPSTIKRYLHRLSDEDINYLKEKYGYDYVRTGNTGS